MKRISRLLIMVFCFTIVANWANAQVNLSKAKPKLEVTYFYGNTRSDNCLAVESNTRKLLQDKFKNELEKRIIIFITYNYDDPANKHIVQKYLIKKSTLLLVKADDTVKDYTAIAFQYAPTDTGRYFEMLKLEIDKILK